MASVNIDVALFYRAGLFGDNMSSAVSADTCPWRATAEEAVEDAPALLVQFGLGSHVQVGSRVMTADQAEKDNALIEAKKEKRAKDAV